MSMSYRRKKLLALFCATALSMTAVAGCTGAKSSTGNVVSSETEVNAEETVAQSETGTFSSTDMFTERDLAGTYEESGAVYVTLSDDGITGETAGVAINGQTMTITAEGTYIFSGTLSEGQIVVDADNAKVQIVFDNVDITCASSAAVYVKSAEKVFVTLAEGSQNTLRNTDEYVAIDDNNIDAVIFAKSDLTLNGTGSLTIVSAEGHGIVSKDDLKITGGTYDITAAGHALSGKDSVRIADGTFILTAEKDGIHAENADDEEKGYIYIADGDFAITSDGDGMDASNIVQIEDGTFDITAGGGAANSLKTHESDMPGGGMSQNIERPDGENMPQDTTTDESGTSTKGIKAGGGMYLNGGTYQIDSADDSIHSNANITIADGTYTLATGDDGVHADDALTVNGGTITVTESYEGLEGLTVTINDGTIDITARDDGINTAGGTDQSGFGTFGDHFKGMDSADDETEETTDNEMWMELNGGYIHILAGGDGVDSNGDLTINGGEIYIDGPSDNGNSAIDYGDRSSAYVNGGTLVAIGSSGMAEVMSDSSKQKVLMVKLGEQMEAGNVVLTDSEGNVIVSYTALKTYDCVIISTAEVESGATYTLATSGTTTEVTAE
ncbi:carbohydrate-binding domain-containing protein [Roseburia inulinivorans]|uniref:Carbohydrate-binding domain-containing protein n=2 Tax=Roseburia inulinivorans TaxID=360807 RepID=A0A414QTT7_9FIRM|nr:carbohydrate-binding domain-containing protein [Roseburia inulinivorans]